MSRASIAAHLTAATFCAALFCGGALAEGTPPAADPVGRWSATEDHPDEAPGDVDTAAAADDARPPADDTSPTSPRRAATGFEEIAAEVNEAKAARDEAAAGPADDPHDHYIPPPPPPLPEGDNITKAAWVGVLGGPLWLILATLLGWGPGGITGLIAVLAFVAGFITLVARMGDDRSDDEDDGAVV